MDKEGRPKRVGESLRYRLVLLAMTEVEEPVGEGGNKVIERG
jgi:hypothetical protein